MLDEKFKQLILMEYMAHLDALKSAYKYYCIAESKKCIKELKKYGLVEKGDEDEICNFLEKFLGEES